MKNVLFLITFFFTLLGSTPVKAQKEKAESLLTQDQINKISEIVKPIRDQLEKRLSRDETYKAYTTDIAKLNTAKNFKEKSSLTNRINEKYSGFFKEIWSTLKVDEADYQSRIRRAFLPDLGKLITFDPFLVFTLIVSTSAPIAPVEPPPNKCLDICPMAAGEINGSSGLIAGGGGSYGNCYLRTNAWSAVFGGNNYLLGYLRNNITIPGTLPADARKLHVRKSWECSQEATTFAALGGGYAETRAQTFKVSEYMLVYSPVIFGSHAIKKKTMSEDYVLEKKDVALSIFRTSANTFSAFISGNWCYSECAAIRWSICEEK